MGALRPRTERSPTPLRSSSSASSTNTSSSSSSSNCSKTSTRTSTWYLVLAFCLPAMLTRPWSESRACARIVSPRCTKKANSATALGHLPRLRLVVTAVLMTNPRGASSERSALRHPQAAVLAALPIARLLAVHAPPGPLRGRLLLCFDGQWQNQLVAWCQRSGVRDRGDFDEPRAIGNCAPIPQMQTADWTCS